MEYLENQRQIIKEMEREVPGLKFENLLEFEVFDFNYFKNKSKKEFVSWYMLNTFNLYYLISTKIFGNKDIIMFEEICDKLHCEFSIQYNESKGYSISLKKQDDIEYNFQTLKKMLEAAEYFELKIGKINELEYIFGNENEIKKMVMIIQSLAFDELKREERSLVKKLNPVRGELNQKINAAYDKVLGEIYDSKINLNV